MVGVGQLKALLDLRLVWNDGPSMLLVCSSGQRYVLIKAKIFHHIPISTQEELKVLVAAIEDFTVNENLWSYHDWHADLDKDFEILGNSIRQDHPQKIDGRRVRCSILPRDQSGKRR